MVSYNKNSNPVTKRISSLVSLLALSSLGLSFWQLGCGGGPVPSQYGQLDRPDGLAPLLDDGCEAADDGTYVLGYIQTPGGDQSALSADLERIKNSGGSVMATYAPQIPLTVAQLPADLLQSLRQNPELSFVSKNCKYHKQSTGLAQAPWALDRIDQRQRPGDLVYQMSGTGKGVDVYVIDTGIYIEHPEFGGRANKLFSAVQDGRDPGDCDGHGTEVAALIGGTVHGAAKEARLQAVRVADCAGVSNDSWIASGIQQAIIHHQANRTPGVLSISLARPGLSMPASVALDAASAAGLLVVAAAGNFGVDACSHFPASRPVGMLMPQRDPEPIVVGVVNSNDEGLLSGVSRTAPIQYDYGNCIDLFAPGDNVETISHLNNTSEIIDSGTSLSAGLVAGVAALTLEKYPSATPAEVKTAILQQATVGVVTGSMTAVPKLLYSIPNIKGASVDPRAIQLARPVLSQPVMQGKETFAQATFTYGSIPTSYRAILSSDLSGVSATAVDDTLNLECVDVDTSGAAFGVPRNFKLDYSKSCFFHRDFQQPPTDLGDLVARNHTGRCTLKLSDKCGESFGNSSLFLNFLP